MNVRTFLFSILAAGVAQCAASVVASADDSLLVRLHPDSPEIGVIKVDGKPDGTYNKILTKTLEYGIYVRGERPPNAIPGTSRLHLSLFGGEWIRGTLTDEWKRYTLTMPYRDLPHSTPINLCNDRLQNLLGAQRREFLKTGTTFSYGDAYEVWVTLSWTIDAASGPYTALGRNHMKVPVKIKCLGLNRDRSEAEGPGRSTEPLPPALWKTTFKIEPANMVRDGRYICPSELKLHGFMEAGRKFQGKAIFMGPHYLSAVTPLHFSHAGTRSLVATYPMKWHQIGGLTATSDPKPKKQELTFRFNISDLDGKLVESMTKKVEVSCSKIKPSDTAVDGGMTVAPAN